MLTYADVRAARPAAWRQTAGGWRRLAQALAVRADAVDELRARLAAQWHGAAATAALAALAALATAVRALRGPALTCDQALCEHAGEVERVQHRLAALVAAPGSPLVSVAADGSVTVSRAGLRPDPFDLTVARRTAEAVDTLLRAATVSDQRAGARLREAAQAFGTPPAVPARPVTPASCSTPAEVRQGWDTLSPAERTWLLGTRPAELGSLDGVPVAARDTANRLVLDRLLTTTRDPARLNDLTVLGQRLATAEGGRAYLVALDPAGDGRAVVAMGDPDHAAHVLTHVPGAGTDLGDIGGLLRRTDRLAGAAAGDEPVSTVLWLGYDPPEWLSSGGTGAASAGAHDLDRFQEGLRATAAGPPAHHTVLGHSYGSLVVGVAARDHGLPVDDMVFVGSPGVGVDHAAQLGVPAGHVWASTARYDLVRATALADSRPEWFDRDVGADRWHGTDPGSAAFGGRPFTSDPGRWHSPVAAHDAYFDEGNRSLAAIGAIARGDYEEVR